MTPTTPLPWTLANGHYQHITGDDAAYIVHACNAYPRLVAELQRLCIEIPKQLGGGKPMSNQLLRELGEQK